VIEIVFSNRALRDWKRLETSVQDQIRRKLDFYVESGDPLKFAEKLHDTSLGEYRFRVGNYRVIFDWDGTRILVLRAGHRKEIYRS